MGFFRELWRFVKVLLVGIVLALGGGYWWLTTSLPDHDTDVHLAGLAESVTIRRDRRGIPHISAGSERDAYFALGYVHAQDRLWQMEAMRRLGAGRLAEVVGAPALSSDRLMRTLGLYRLAEAQVDRLSVDAQAALNAYAAGVNAWLAGRARWKALPPEFLVLNIRPEPWRPADSLVWAKIMALRLSGNWRTEILRAQLSAFLTPEQLDDLWPPAPAPRSSLDTASLDSESRPPPVILHADAGAVDRAFPRALVPDPADPQGASNAWAVSVERSRSGMPILANDPHLGYSAPILWYLARISSPSLNVTGATIPGVPMTILGHNNRIAWGMTTTHSDQADLFTEVLAPGDRDSYMTPDGPRAFATRTEVIKVRGGADETLTVRATRHGPVVSDVLARTGGAALAEDAVWALAAPFLDADDLTPQALYDLNQARDWQTFETALRPVRAPQQTVTYADVDGNIGFIAPGWVPRRAGHDGRLPRDGRSGDDDWTGPVPFTELPQDLNPITGRLANANNRVFGTGDPKALGDDFAAPYRAQRILDELDDGASQSPNLAVRLQRDAVSLMARDLVPLMVRGARGVSPRSQQALDLLATWDGDMRRDRPEPLIFQTWLRETVRILAADELGEDFPRYWRPRALFVRRVLTERPEWCDDVTTPAAETCDTQLGLALDRTMADLTERHGPDTAAWRWGDEHRARFIHPLLGRLPPLGPLEHPLVRRALSMLQDHLVNVVVEVDGGPYTVNRADVRYADDRHPFAAVHGGGLRAVYDLADLRRSRFMIATGQSGNPLSWGYRDLVEDWQAGKAYPLERIPDHVQKLVPGG
ncbi:MAG: penicillin acylase family protein [Rhodobacterales bacterium]|nr:penicillin acylase family protein [Rhodobacterales bacterium]